jgi:hypothetical protein
MNWTEEMKIAIINITTNYTDQDRENLQIDYFKNLLTKIEDDNLILEPDLKLLIESVIHQMPVKSIEKKIEYKSKHLNNISNIQTAVAQKYDLVKKNKFTKKYLALGISIGMLFGLPLALAIGNIALGPALGIPIGLSIGLTLGKRLDKKAVNENRVL